jgi:hypothetical protein
MFDPEVARGNWVTTESGRMVNLNTLPPDQKKEYERWHATNELDRELAKWWARAFAKIQNDAKALVDIGKHVTDIHDAIQHQMDQLRKEHLTP